MPILIIHGTRDIDIPFSQTELLTGKIPHAQLLAIQGADHISSTGHRLVPAAIHNFVQDLS